MYNTCEAAGTGSCWFLENNQTMDIFCKQLKQSSITDLLANT